MEIRNDTEGKKLIILLDKRIDQMNAAQVEEELMVLPEKYPGAAIEFDAAKLAYISSAGLRVLMKVRKKAGEAVVVRDVSPDVYEIFDTTGFTQLLDVHKRMRELSVDGCDIIGRGFFGTVYRLDSETIVKVYKGKDSILLIENEKKMAQKAFLAGIPTAISYDIVKVGEDYGSVFELLNAKSFHDMVQKGIQPMEETVRQYVSLLKLVHQTELKKEDFPSFRERYLEYLEVIRGQLSDSQYEGLKKLISAMPEAETAVHGDIQMKNVMMVENEPMLIDMDTIGRGNPVFELAGLYVTYQEFTEDDPGNSMAFLEMPGEMVDELWEKILEGYFGFGNDDDRQRALLKIRLAAAVRFLYLLESTDLKNHPLTETRVKHTKEHIDELLPVVDSLAI